MAEYFSLMTSNQVCIIFGMARINKTKAIIDWVKYSSIVISGPSLCGLNVQTFNKHIKIS